MIFLNPLLGAGGFNTICTAVCNSSTNCRLYHLEPSTLQGSLTMAATQQTFPQTPTVTTTDIKTNMCHIHTSIVSASSHKRQSKILCPPPPHISSSKEILPRLTHRPLAQLRTNKSPIFKSYLDKGYAKTHPSLLCPLCNIHTHDTHHLFNCTHIRTTLSPLDLWTDPAGVTALLARWTEKLAGGAQSGRSYSTPPPH